MIKACLVAVFFVVRFLRRISWNVDSFFGKLYEHLDKALALKPGLIVEQTEHKDKSKGPWILVSYHHDASDYYLVKPQFYENMREKGAPSFSAGEYVYVYRRYLKIVGSVQAA